ncbi:hypothetical protein Tco_1064810 [Tanacetum coccineum]
MPGTLAGTHKTGIEPDNDLTYPEGDTRRNFAQQILSLSQKPKPDASPDTLTRASRRLCVDQTPLVTGPTCQLHGRSLIKQHNERARTPIVTPICLTFHDDGDGGKGKDIGQSSRDEGDEDLKKPYKEVLKSPFTRRIIEFSAPSLRMPTT